MMKSTFSSLFLWIAFAQAAFGAPLYDCKSKPPEKPGSHNMVLFGVPGDELYLYHLPLFAGEENGSTGHVLMHVYQALWNVKLDPATKAAYDQEFLLKKNEEKPFPFFSIGPKGKPFRVPEMICNPGFALSAEAVYGHIEGNSNFPAPMKLVDRLSDFSVKGEPIFARRFDGSSRKGLSYFIFGTPKQYYMAHYLTDDQNSFDQILGIEILGDKLKALVKGASSTLVNLSNEDDEALIPVPGSSAQSRPNNRAKLSVRTPGRAFKVSDDSDSLLGEVRVTGEIYFNADTDLRK